VLVYCLGIAYCLTQICQALVLCISFWLFSSLFAAICCWLVHKMSCWFWLVGPGFLAGSGWFACACQAGSAVGTLWDLNR
jgi:hypothetical protein